MTNGPVIMVPNIRKGDTNMDTVIKNYLEQMKVGRKQSHKNLALYPLLSTYSVGLESRKITGFALGLDDQLLHLSIFARTDGQDRNNSNSRIERFSSRRRNRRA
jgi:hypothetical protein